VLVLLDLIMEIWVRPLVLTWELEPLFNLFNIE